VNVGGTILWSQRIFLPHYFFVALARGLNKLHNVSYRFTGTLVDSAAISNIQYGFLGEGAGGVFFDHKEYSSRIISLLPSWETL